MFSKDILSEQLKSNVLVVTFIKINGDRRVMRCTLKPELFPPSETHRWLTEGKRPGVSPNENVLPVFDLEVEGWRSFRIDRVQSVEVEIDEADGVCV